MFPIKRRFPPLIYAQNCHESNLRNAVICISSAACAPPMVFFNCSANGPASKGTECEKSCNTLDMTCVSNLFPNKEMSYTKSHTNLMLTVLYGCNCKSDPFLQVTTGCSSGCMCPSGMVSDSEGSCIKPEDCPCVHNGIAYQPGGTIKVDCNTW